MQGTKEGICTEVMSQAAAQIMNYNGTGSDQKYPHYNGGSKLSGAHSSVRELNFQVNGGGGAGKGGGTQALERFNSRTHNKVKTSEASDAAGVPYEAAAEAAMHEIGQN